MSHLSFTEKSSKTQKKGAKAEQLAWDFLQQKGALLLDKNVLTPYGEIDLIVLYQGILIFAEVKCRKNEKFFLIHETITAKKRQCLEQSIFYLTQQKQEWQSYPQRLDALLIIEQPFQIRWLQQI
jgi:putative endonuclease